MKKIYIGAAILLSSITAQAQFTYNYLKAANTYYAKGDYSSASNYYEKYLTAGKQEGDKYDPYSAEALTKKDVAKSDGHLQAVYNLAESYRLLTWYAKAAPLYKDITEGDKARFPLSLYYYAAVLKKLEQYKEAEAAMLAFVKDYTADDDWSRRAKQELQSLRFIQEQLHKADIKLYTVSKSPVNAEGATYAPAWLDDNTLLFTSTRTESGAAKNSVHTNRVYEATGVAGAATKTSLPQVAGEHQGVISITADGKRMYLTRWAVRDGRKSAAIFTCERNGNSWSEPVAMDAAVNAAGYNNQQPFISADGKWLLLSSDRPGGAGGYDIWIVSLEGTTHIATNPGKVINTPDDEQAPYYHAPSGTLVFASNGRTGMGGFDLFGSKGKPGSWAEPRNLGYPVNSVKDDMYFVSKGGAKNLLADVLISSDRSSACCLEIISLQKQQPAKSISGIVLDCATSLPLAGVSVVVTDTVNGTGISKLVTGTDGRYSFALPDYQRLKVTASVSNYLPGSLSFNTPADEEALSLDNPALCLQHEPKPVMPEVGEIRVMHNMYYALNSAEILDTSKASLDEMVQMLKDNPTVTIEISGHTDNSGTRAHNLKLSQQRAENVVAYLISKGIDAGRLKAIGYGQTQPVASDTNPDGSDNPAGRAQNRRTEFKILSK